MSEELRIAERQYGLVTRVQLRELGITRHQIEYRVTRGRLDLVYPCVYRVVGSVPSARQRAMAATLWLGRGSAISHATTGSWLHLDGIRTDELHVSVPATNRRRSNNADLTIHRVVSLPPHDVRIIDGVSCTSAARTLFDVAVSLDDEALETAMESARRLGLTTINALQRVQRELGPRPGAATFGAVLSVLERRPLESRLEIKVARLLERSSIPPSIAQFRIGPYRVDRAWPERRVAIEADGFQHHGRRLDWKRDRRRIAAIEAMHWRIVHVTWEDVTREPSRTLDRIASALGILST